MKFRGSTSTVPLILSDWNADAVGGMCGVAVKCVEIGKNIGGESALLDGI